MIADVNVLGGREAVGSGTGFCLRWRRSSTLLPLATTSAEDVAAR